MNSTHALKVAVRMLQERRNQTVRRLNRGLGARAQTNALQEMGDIDDVIAALVTLREEQERNRP